MSASLHLLLVADREPDVEPILHELQRAGYAPRCQRVATEPEFLSSLQPALDLILCLDHLAQFDGRRALKLLRARALEIPFILVASAINEDTAIACMQEGATDYLLADRLARLGPLAAQVLEQKRLREDTRRAEQAVRDSEWRFRALIDHGADAVALISPRGTILYASSTITRVLGYASEERAGTNVFAHIHPQDVERVRLRFERLVTEPDGRVTIALREQHKDGSWRWLEVNGANLLAEPSVQAIVWNYRDVTDRQRSEEAYRTLVEQSLQGIAVYQAGRIVFANRALSEMFGYSVDELLAFSAQQASELIHMGDRAQVAQRIQDRLAGRPVPAHFEFRTVRKDGTICWLHISAQRVEYRGQPSIQITALDISERRQVEEKLQRRADEFAALYDTTHELSAQLDLDALLETIVERTRQLLHTASVAVYLYDPLRAELELVINKNSPARLHTRLKLGEGMAGHVAQTRRPLIVDDYRAWHGRSPQYTHIPFTAVLGVPLLYRGELIGVLGVNELHETTRKFTQADAQLLSLFAAHVAGAIHNARLFEETRVRLAELEIVNKVSSALRGADTLEQMLPIILDEALGALQTTAGIIRLYDANADQLCTAAVRGWGTQFTAPIKPDVGLIGHVFTTDTPYITPDAKLDPQTSQRVRSLIPPDWSAALVPLRSATATIGVMVVGLELPRTVESNELHLLTTLAELAGTAIQRARLYEETERRVQRLASLRKIDMAITSSVDLRVTLNVLLDQITTQLGIDAAAVLLADANTQSLEYVASRGFHSSGLMRSRVRLGERYAGRVALERHMVAIPNLTNATGRLGSTSPLASEQFASYFGFPLMVKGEVKGVLELFHRSTFDPDPELLEFLETLAGQTAIALDNMALFEKLQRRNDELRLAYDTTLEGWSRALDLRDKKTEGHTLRVTEMTMRLARGMRLSESELVHVRRGALLHDIGKMGIPDGILLKPGTLNDEEWSIMRMHPVYAYELLSPISYLRRALEIPYCHHEKWDGTGYPRGLKGEAIPIAARIFAVVDVYDALRSDRPYSDAWPIDKVREHIRSLRGSHFDSRAVDVFLSLDLESSE